MSKWGSENEVENSVEKIVPKEKKNLGFFPGSTIGNFCPDDARNLLKKFANILGKNNHLVIGIDIRKDRKLMEKAYNDSNGITAKFNKNILVGINKKLDAKFDADNFEHLANINEKKKESRCI